ncbi:restriction endonuclease subunit S [Methanofollis tationis]|uniref:Restriction endonuclease subunit S n=1 Tax=Methanofollis tationis TaxID=81417 RepID=A0A7K4HL96_9EURY|nr:restriction endonuclease subunit S [Methanofollis tationis]NVO65817.1 restriction endonuclease subunit S [Methanofollis tationis]
MTVKTQLTLYGHISCDFSESKLEQICIPKVGVQTGPFGSQLHNEDYVESGTPIITVEHLGENRILHENTPFVSDEDRIRLKKYSLKCGDIVFSRVGSVDRRALVRKTEDGWLFSGRCLRVRVNREVIDPVYLSYFFGLDSFKEYIRSIAVGATMPSLNTKILSDIPIYYPPLPEQHAIARILSSLDDKIELNRKINATLEAMAQALFTSWFVDFDPVRAKAEGRAPAGMDEETAALFPDGFEEVDGREVPVGWRVAPLTEVIEVNPRVSLSKGEVAPYLDMKNMPMQGHRAIEWVDRPFGSGVKFMNGDTLLARITPCLENGKTAYVDFLKDDQVGWGSTEYIVFRPKPPLPKEYGYCLARSEELRTYAILNMTGTSGRQRVSASCFENYLVVVPSSDIAKSFERIVKSIMVLIKQKDEESRTLAALRDTLLPRLISGEVRVPVDEGERATIEQTQARRW